MKNAWFVVVALVLVSGACTVTGHPICAIDYATTGAIFSFIILSVWYSVQ